VPPPPPTPEERAEIERSWAEIRSRPDALSGIPATPPSPEAGREAELLERALTNSPDYAQAVRRAAVANINEAPPVPRERPQAREARIAAEEARLSDLIEKRRRERLAMREQSNRASQDQAAIAACEARGAQIDASMYSRRSILNLDGAIAGAQARNACIEAYRRTGVMP
jgi:hypothetical protein